MQELDAAKVSWITSLVVGPLFSVMFTLNLILRCDSSRAQPAAVGPCRAALDATIFLFEVPIGVIADVYSCRNSTIIGNHILPAGRVGDHRHHPLAGCGAFRTSDWKQGRLGAVSVVSA